MIKTDNLHLKILKDPNQKNNSINKTVHSELSALELFARAV